MYRGETHLPIGNNGTISFCVNEDIHKYELSSFERAIELLIDIFLVKLLLVPAAL